MHRRAFIAAIGASAVAGCTALDDGPNDSGGSSGTAAGEPGDGRDDGDGSSDTADERDDGAVHAKVDLHSHLRRGGGQAMADEYAAQGFDALVGTDYSDDLGVPGEETAEQVGDYSDLEFPGPILDGVELVEGRHVNVIESENERIKQINHPMMRDADAEEIQTLADEIGAEFVEVTAQAEELNEFPTPSEAVEELDLLPTVTSDGREPEEVGTGYVVVEVPELTGDEILRALQRGDYALGVDAVW